ncbi:MAG: acylphosphatase [Abditibacteriaceae bacterium]
MEQTSCRVVIKGRVQGVMFRASCAHVAKRENITGYAKNLPDGSVEVLLEGDASAVKKVLSWCHQGPATARVDAVNIHNVPASNNIDFTVL